MPASNPNLTPHFNTRVLMSDAQFMSNELAINPYMDTSEPFDVEKAIRQHRGIQEALTSIGIEVVKIDAPAGCQDGVFTANEALLDVDDETLLMARLPKGREEETPYYEAALRKLGKKIIHLPNADWYFSGQGDALRYGPYLLACRRPTWPTSSLQRSLGSRKPRKNSGATKH